MTQERSPLWRNMVNMAQAIGLNLVVTVTRPQAEAAFQRRQGAGIIPPEKHLARYRTIILLGAGGPKFWETFQTSPEMTDGHPNPLDRFADQQVTALATVLQRLDKTITTAFPFHHIRQVIPFQALIEHTPLAGTSPIGIAIHPEYGPWFAWRGIILSEQDWPEKPALGDPPCLDCPAPCLQACPVGAARLQGLEWEVCLSERRQESPCRHGCAARANCRVGVEHRYGEEQTTYHAAASRREIMKLSPI